MLTQTHPDKLHLPMPKQEHEPVAFLSGSFTKTQQHWGVIEKEPFLTIKATDPLRHFVLSSNGFRLYLFNPWFSDADFKNGQTMPMGDKTERIPLYYGAHALRKKCLGRYSVKVEAKIKAKVNSLIIPKALVNLVLNKDLAWCNFTEIRAAQEESICDEETCIL